LETALETMRQENQKLEEELASFKLKTYVCIVEKQITSRPNVISMISTKTTTTDKMYTKASAKVKTMNVKVTSTNTPQTFNQMKEVMQHEYNLLFSLFCFQFFYIEASYGNATEQQVQRNSSFHEMEFISGTCLFCSFINCTYYKKRLL
jgi:hypothetical protein